MLSTKKFACALLAICTVFSSLTFVSCDKDDKESTPAVTVSQENADETEELYPDYLPEALDFDKKEITFLVMGDGYNSVDWRSQDIYAETDSDDPIVSAVYRRNMFLEEEYNVKIREVASDAPGTTAQNSIKSGLDEFQVLMCNTASTISLMQNQLLLDLNSLEYLDLTQPWWDQTMRENCSIAGKNYFATGDISIMDNDATWVMMFNKQLAKNYGFDPYKLVEENNWTFDEMHKMMMTAANDNGDGVVKWEDDTFGLSTHHSTCEAFFYAAGLSVTQKDSSDLPYFDATASHTDYIMRVLEKSISIWEDESVLFASDGVVTHSEETQEVFESGRALFLAEVLQLAIRLREMDVDFGVLPFPKYQASQKNYGHFVHSTTALLSIPITCKDKDNVSALVEAMAAKSMYTLTPAYYDVVLTGKAFRDEESADMLDIILKSRTFDLGGIHMFDWGNIGSIFPEIVRSGSNNYASLYKRGISRATATMNKDIDKILSDNPT